MSERLFSLACAAMFVFGIVLALPGTVLGLPDAVAALGLTLAGRGTLISALFVGLLLGSLASGPLVDKLGHRASLALSAGLVALCLPLFAAAPTAILAGLALVALGLAAAGMNTASNALSSDLFPTERARRMNLLGILAALGGLALPITTVLASGAASWRAVVVGGALLAAVVAVACARVRVLSPVPTLPHSATDAFKHFARRPGFALFGLLLMLGGGNEASMAGWTSTYLNASGFSAAASTWALSAHWLGLILARVLLSARAEHAKSAAITRSALCGAACVLIFVSVRVPVVLAVGPFAIGVAIALIVPTSLALAGDRYPGNAGTLFGLLLTLAQVGGIALPAAIGLVSDRAGLHAGLSLLVLSGLGVALVMRSIARRAV
ncbi:MAG TPA: MFS transporter [Vicinamibacterales bacterium]|nr:MFS transporter [Vicinamibacterales bacterium]